MSENMDPIPNNAGRADIVDWTEEGLYEIKPVSAEGIGQLTVQWYLFNYYEANGEYAIPLKPGASFGPAQIIGRDPNDPNQWILAEQRPLGVTVYWARKIQSHDPVPVFVYEWDPESGEVRERRVIKAQNTCSLPPGVAVGVGATGVIGTAYLIWWYGKLFSPVCGPLAPACAVVF